MSYRIQCAACGKVMTLEDDAAGEPLVCVACGTRLEAPPPPIVQARESESHPDAGPAAANAPAANGGRAGAQAVRRSGMGSRTTTILTAAAVSFAVVAIAGLVVALLVSRNRSGGRATTSEEMRANADLLALKSEAEALAIDGRLAEAHEKYRTLQQLAVGRDIKDPLLWDIMDRAKLDQDNVYMLLLRQQIPPGERMDATAPPPLAGADAAGPAEEEPPQPQPGDAPDDATAMAEGGEGAAGDEAPSIQEAAATQPEGPTLVAHAPPADSVTDEQIGEAMKRGVDFLLARMKDGQLAEGPGLSGVKRDGMNALAVYALLTSGQAMNDERLDVRGDLMKGMIEKMKSHDFKSRRGEPQQPVTYARSLRAAALAVYNRSEDRKVLKEDVDWLVAAAVNGAYTYDDQLTRNYTAANDRRAGESEEAAFDEAALGETADDDGALAAAGQLTGMAGAAGTLSDDTSVHVFALHGIHDSKGREIYAPMRMPTGRTPLRGYPPRPLIGARTRPPGTGGPPPQQRTRIPDDWYRGNRRGMTEGPGETPGREGDGGGTGSLSSPFPWDNSNSQYGLLGVWSGAEVGVEVPVRYWKDVERHWTGSQLSGGEWGYLARDRSGYFAMTCGGVASLFVTHDWLAAPALKDGVGREPLTPALAQGLAWLERSDNAVSTPNPKTHYIGYDLYGLERVALASGFKYFGKHDWYRELSANALGMQWPTGAWGREDDGPDAIVDTAYTLLFLARGRHPILMNKLRFERSEVARVDGKPAPGFWANRPRDVANLTRFASRQLERGLNWQVVSLAAPAHDWLDSPVLYIASHQAPALEDGDYEKLRQYVEAGGMLFTHADTGAAPFNRWVAKLAEKVAPGRALEDLPEDHVLYDVNYKIKAPRPKLQAVSNGSRLLLVHSPSDLGAQWQQRADKASAEVFRLGLNLALYASGKAAFRNRLDTPNVPAPKNDPIGSVKIARVKYDGNWDPEPGAWPRFGRLFQWQTRFATEVTPVDLAGLKDSGAPVAHLTGTEAYTFTDADVAAVKAYVEAGGVLLVDTCGGYNPFRESVEDALLSRAFPGVDANPVPQDHPLLKPEGQAEPLVPKARPYAMTAFQDGVPPVKLLKAGKGHVVVSPLDLTSGLLATNAWGIAGYDPATSQSLVRNLLMWAHAAEGAGAAGNQN